MTESPKTPGTPAEEYRFSYGRFVVYVLGAGAIVLVLFIPIILGMAKWNPTAGLVSALVAVLAMIAAIGFTSRYQIGKAEKAIRASRGEGPPD
ncbi:hypothetical protein ACWDPV_16920 [Gordonia sp. NPDC003504]|jgi:uncharacterized membrane protein YkgB